MIMFNFKKNKKPIKEIDESRRDFFKKLGIGAAGVAGTMITVGPIQAIAETIGITNLEEKQKLEGKLGAFFKQSWKLGYITFIEYEVPQNEQAIFFNEKKNTQKHVPMYNLKLRKEDETTIISQVLLETRRVDALRQAIEKNHEAIKMNHEDKIAFDNNKNKKFSDYDNLFENNGNNNEPTYCYIVRITGKPELFGVIRSNELLKYDGTNPYRHVG